MPVIAHHVRAGANLRPDVILSALLAHPDVILGPSFDRPTGSSCAGEQSIRQGDGEVFEKSPASLCGSKGRGYDWAKRNLCNHCRLYRLSRRRGSGCLPRVGQCKPANDVDGLIHPNALGQRSAAAIPKRYSIPMPRPSGSIVQTVSIMIPVPLLLRHMGQHCLNSGCS